MTAYEMRISDWSSVVCSSDLAWLPPAGSAGAVRAARACPAAAAGSRRPSRAAPARAGGCRPCRGRRPWRRPAGWVTGCVRCSWSSLSVRCPRAVAARHQQVRGDVLFLPCLERALLAAPAVAALLQRLLPGLGAEERLARLHQLPFGGLQRLVRLRQTLARRFDLPAQPVDVRLALRKPARPVHARRGRSEEHTSELQSLM